MRLESVWIQMAKYLTRTTYLLQIIKQVWYTKR